MARKAHFRSRRRARCIPLLTSRSLQRREGHRDQNSNNGRITLVIRHSPLELSPLTVDGLLEVQNQKKPRYADSRLFVAKNNAQFTDAIECNMRDSLHSKQCIHYLAYRNIDVTASYSYKLLSEWRTIRSRINSFLNCTYAEEIPNKTGGKLIWD